MRKIITISIAFFILIFSASITHGQFVFEEETGVKGDAKISSFTLDKTTVNTKFNDNQPTAQFTAFFSGTKTDLWRITLDCPVPTTVPGLEERIDMIKTGGTGVSSPSKEGEQCNFTQTGAASLTQFSFLLINPFQTPQSVTLILNAYTWNGSKYTKGDTQSQTLTVLPN